jgi:signal transduction histidine kinase
MNTAVTSLPGSILVVDDTPANLKLLTGMLKARGYRVKPAPNGELALRGARAAPPDLILLDITMPGMDGLEVCARLKADERLCDIPVLFISALQDTDNKVRAFQAGGVDYVTKPFQLEEVEARVRTHLEIRRQKRELEANFARLRELEKMRDSLIHMIAHDMKSPLTVIQLAFELIAPSIEFADSETATIVRDARVSATMIVEMIEQMLDISRMEAGALTLKLASGDPVETVRQAVESQRALAGHRRLTFAASGPAVADFDANLLRRAVGNLVGNAIKFTDADGEIRVSAVGKDGFVRVEVADNGRGIAPEHHVRIFEKFGQVEDKRARMGTGLGLTFARMAIEAHGGNIGVVSALREGSTFWITLPTTATAQPHQ